MKMTRFSEPCLLVLRPGKTEARRSGFGIERSDINLSLTTMLQDAVMRVWLLEACRDEYRYPSRWGYAFAEDPYAALHLARYSSRLPFNWVHEKPATMLWPGAPQQIVYWFR